MASKTERTIINAAGLVQGIVLVTFPAASTIFTDTSEYGLSSSQYGAMFLPQVALAAEQGNHRQPARHAGGPYQRMRESQYESCAWRSITSDGRAGSFNFSRAMKLGHAGDAMGASW